MSMFYKNNLLAGYQNSCKIIGEKINVIFRIIKKEKRKLCHFDTNFNNPVSAPLSMVLKLQEINRIVFIL